jgi:hypothetical protein
MRPENEITSITGGYGGTGPASARLVMPASLQGKDELPERQEAVPAFVRRLFDSISDIDPARDHLREIS